MRAYAEATDDVPGGPVFGVVPVWEAIAPASRAVASEDARRFIVHYEQDIVLHRPLAAGIALLSRATPVAILPRPNGTSLVIKTETRGEDGELVNEQYVTEFFRGVGPMKASVSGHPTTASRSTGNRRCDHVSRRGRPDGQLRRGLGDDFAIHLDDEFARQVGLPGRIVHGLCTMAFAGRAVLEAVGVDDPRAVGRIAVRFSAPLFPGQSVTTRVWRSRALSASSR